MRRAAGLSSLDQTASQSLLAPALNAIRSCSVTLSRRSEELRAACGAWQEEKGPLHSGPLHSLRRGGCARSNIFHKCVGWARTDDWFCGGPGSGEEREGGEQKEDLGTRTEPRAGRGGAGARVCAAACGVVWGDVRSAAGTQCRACPWRAGPARVVFGRMLGSCFSWHGPQTALKCSYRSDRVTRD